MPYQILGDVHTHTLYSEHAYSTIQENVEAAAAAGLEILGSADHFSCMVSPHEDVRSFQFFNNVHIWPREWMGVTLLRGCEVDIVGLGGELFGQDIPVTHNIVLHPLSEPTNLFSYTLRDLDYVVASVHNRDFASNASVAQGTDMYTKVLEQPKVLILGHTGRSGVAFDVDEVLTCAKEHNKLMEINDHSLDMDPEGTFHERCAHLAERCAEMGVGIVVDSDAHIAPCIGQFSRAQRLLESIHFPEELIMNRGREPFLRQMAAAGVCDLTDLL